MGRVGVLFVTLAQRWLGARGGHKGVRSLVVQCATSLMPLMLPVNALAGSNVEFDIAPTVECRDVTPAERISQYPSQRMIEVTLPVSVRFRGVAMDEVDELAIEVNGASAGMRVHDFSPATQLFTDISHEIETTTTTSSGPLSSRRTPTSPAQPWSRTSSVPWPLLARRSTLLARRRRHS